MTTGVSLRFLKYLESWLTSFGDFAEMGEGIFSMMAETDVFLFKLFLLMIVFVLEVNFAEIFCLTIYEFLLAIKES